MNERRDDFKERRQHLKNMSDEELKTYFFELADKMVEPLIDLARNHTSKSIERSVLLRMGFSSPEASGIVDRLADNDLLAKGAGHCVYRVARDFEQDVRESGLEIAKGRHLSYLKEVLG